MEIADEVTIIRDGAWISSGPIGNYTSDKIISLMVGRKISNIFSEGESAYWGHCIGSQRTLQQRRIQKYKLLRKRGEILGFAGLVGAGRSEVMRAVFGLDEYQSGEIFVNGKKAEIHRTEMLLPPESLWCQKIEERRESSPFVPRERILRCRSLKIQEAWSIRKKAESRMAEEMIEKFQIKVSTPEQEIRIWSGGNQQKVILAKWLLGNPKVLI